MEVQLLHSRISELYGVEWLASHSGRFRLGERTFGIQLIRDYVGPTALILDILKREKSGSIVEIRNPGHPTAVQPS
jgi:hypothetical protein